MNDMARSKEVYQAEIVRARSAAKNLRVVAGVTIVISLIIIIATVVFWMSDELSSPIALLIALFAVLGGLLTGERSLASATSIEIGASRLEVILETRDAEQ